MTTTLELPDQLVAAMTDQARRESRSVDDLVEKILAQYFPIPRPVPADWVKTAPVIRGTPLPPGIDPGPPLTVEEIKDLEMQEELERYERCFRQ